jgi:DNA-binding transcriptional ArsR family regulator
VDVDVDDVLRALAHPARRAIIGLCSSMAVAAGDLAIELELAPATTSEHLRVLRTCGLIDRESDGTWRRYRTNRTVLRHALKSLSVELLTPSNH